MVVYDDVYALANTVHNLTSFDDRRRFCVSTAVNGEEETQAGVSVCADYEKCTLQTFNSFPVYRVIAGDKNHVR